MKSPMDSVVIQNIDMDCSDTTIEYYKKIDRELDDDGNLVSVENDIPEEFDHSEAFQTKYGGVIYSIASGKTRRLPRYIAEKYAKELIDHLLYKKEETTGTRNLIDNPKERKELLDKIIISEDLLDAPMATQDNMDNVDTKDSKVLKEEEIEYVDPLLGFEKKEEPTVTLEDIKNAPDEEIKDGENIRTRAELMTECKTLGLPVRRTDTTRDLLNKIKAF